MRKQEICPNNCKIQDLNNSNEVDSSEEPRRGLGVHKMKAFKKCCFAKTISRRIFRSFARTNSGVEKEESKWKAKQKVEKPEEDQKKL